MGVGELAEHLTHAGHLHSNCNSAPGNGLGGSGKAPDGELLIGDVICWRERPCEVGSIICLCVPL